MTPKVVDEFCVTRDETMPTLSAALDPAFVEGQFQRKLSGFIRPDGNLTLRSIRVTRHKPGKRCVVEYAVEVKRPREALERTVLIGKVRANRFGKSGYRTLKSLWEAGFSTSTPDNICVPEPIGTVGKLQMWLQRKVPGSLATDLLRTDGAEQLASRIAEAANKIHCSNLAFTATHDMAKEIRILRERLPQVCRHAPILKRRIDCALRAAVEVAASVPFPLIRPIHRDFYSDQVVVDGNRLYLLDFDLCCMGDPAVDIGNFAAHITEQSIRERGDKLAMKSLEDTIINRFNELSPFADAKAVSVYRLLTLVRHIYLSTVVPGRDGHTENVLEACEEELTHWSRESFA